MQSRLLQKLCNRRNKNVDAVALANKIARIIFALPTKETEYKANGDPA